MSATQSKVLSPSELAKLEHAFASDSTSDAYRPLAEAYMSMSRYMEAMVVCKKGVKAHPQSAAPRLLLARVYAEQGKDKKALEECQAALNLEPNDPGSLRLYGVLLLRNGDPEAGRASLLKAWAASPTDEETLELMKAHGVPVPQAVAAAPVAAPSAVAAAPSVTAAPAAASARVAGAAAGPPRLEPISEGAAAPSARAAPQAAARRPAQQVTSAARPPVARAPARDDEDDEPPRRRPRPGAGGQKAFFLGMVVLFPLAIGGYWFMQSQAKARDAAVRRQLSVATEELKHDSFDSYKKVSAAAEMALGEDPDSALAHGFLAYAYTIRWAEHGGGDEARMAAERHLVQAEQQKAALVSSHFLAARALFDMASGKGTEALASLQATIRAFEAEKRQSSLLFLTQGIVQMNLGDLEAAVESLESAQALAPADPRIYAALGTLFLRRGQEAQAEGHFDNALRYERDHPESMLGKAQLILQRDDPARDDAKLIADYATAAELLKKLLEASPPPSPRQLATASMARALLIGRVLHDLPALRADARRKLLESTGIPADRAAAQELLEKSEKDAFGLSSKNPDLHVIRGRRLWITGETDAAIDELRRAVALEKTRAQFHMTLAQALLDKPGREAEAAQALETALKTMGDSPKLLLLHGHALRRQGKLDQAIAEYAKAMGEPKDGRIRSPEARAAMGAALLEKKDVARARTELETAVRELVAHKSLMAMALTELGRVYQAANEADRADDSFKRAITSDGDYAPVYFHYARFMVEARNEPARAKTLAEEYLRRAPKGPFAADAQRML